MYINVRPYLGTGTEYGSGVRFWGTVFGLRFWGTLAQSRPYETWRWFKPLPPFTILILVMILFKSQQKSKNTKYEGQHFPQIAGDDFSICDS